MSTEYISEPQAGNTIRVVASNPAPRARTADYDIVEFPTRYAIVSESDNLAGKADNAIMNDLSRYELDAKLEAIEARMDGRVASIQSEIAVFLAEQRERDKRLDERLEEGRRESDQRFQAVIRDIDRLGNLKANIWGAMATTIVILLAVGALALTSFQAGAVKPASSDKPPAIMLETPSK